jgi:hypothetical protein
LRLVVTRRRLRRFFSASATGVTGPLTALGTGPLAALGTGPLAALDTGALC